MRVVIIDEDAFFRTLARKYLERDLPEAELTERRSGEVLGGGFDWSGVDVLLLGHDLGEDIGLDVLELLGGLGGEVPRVVYLADLGTSELAGVARERGAFAVIDKSTVSGGRLAEVVAAAHRGVALADGLGRRAAPSGSKPGRPDVEGYRIASQIGAGAMSRVFLAEREWDGLTLVLKVIELDLVKHHAHVKRFAEEAELVSELESPHVVRIYDHGFTDELGYMAMEFFPRGDLKQRIELGLPPGDAVHCLANLAYGLDAIHRVGIVHRDLKPANVMFRADDSLALADFGISLRLASGRGVVRPGTVLGTPHYMSPEQGQGKPADVRNDLYSLGVMFYEMLTRAKPFRADSPAELVYEHINAPIPRLPAGLRRYQGLVDRLLAKRPDERFQSASDLIAAL